MMVTYGNLVSMITARATVEGLLLPWLRSWEQSSPQLAKQQHQGLRNSLVDFQLGTLALHAAWMADHPLPEAAWVLAMGETHHQQFRTQAIGPRNRQGVIPVSYGLIANHDAHPAPWHWDVVRLVTSVQLALTKRAAEPVGQAIISDYIRVMKALAQDDNQVERIDYLSLPEQLKQRLDVDVLAKKQRTWLARLVRGKRLRLGSEVIADVPNRAVLTERIQSLLAKNLTLLDMAACPNYDDFTTLGQRRWWMLCQEFAPDGNHILRLGHIVERRTSHLANYLPLNPTFALSGTTTACLNLGHDPLHQLFPVSSGSLMMHSICHARQIVDLTTMDNGDAIRLGRLWGQLLAMYHIQGLRALGNADLAPQAERLANQASTHGRHILQCADEQTSWYQQVYRLFLNKT
jgi:hypothetical protein